MRGEVLYLAEIIVAKKTLPAAKHFGQFAKMRRNAN